MVRVLLAAGARVDAADNNGHTPLHYAAEHGHADVVRALLEAGARADTASSDGNTPLQWAAEHGHADRMRALIEARRVPLCVAFAMALHPRLGARAGVRGLEPGLMREMLALAGLEAPPPA